MVAEMLYLKRNGTNIVLDKYLTRSHLEKPDEAFACALK